MSRFEAGMQQGDQVCPGVGQLQPDMCSIEQVRAGVI